MFERLRNYIYRKRTGFVPGKAYEIKWSDQALFDLNESAKEEGKTLDQLRTEIEEQFCKDMKIRRKEDGK